MRESGKVVQFSGACDRDDRSVTYVRSAWLSKLTKRGADLRDSQKGADTWHFDVSMLSQTTGTCESMDWALMQDLVQHASSAALGRDASVAGNEENMVELMGCLPELREFAAQGANGVKSAVTVVQG